MFVIETNLPFKGCKQKRAGYLLLIFLMMMKIKSDFGEINFKSQNPKFLLSLDSKSGYYVAIHLFSFFFVD